VLKLSYPNNTQRKKRLMQRKKSQLEELNRKQRKVTYLLGEIIYKLYQSKIIRFLYTSEGAEEEKEVKKTLKLLDYICERIKKLEEVYPEETEITGSEKDNQTEEQKEEIAVKENP
jgi:hypothetical protein